MQPKTFERSNSKLPKPFSYQHIVSIFSEETELKSIAFNKLTLILKKYVLKKYWPGKFSSGKIKVQIRLYRGSSSGSYIVSMEKVVSNTKLQCIKLCFKLDIEFELN